MDIADLVGQTLGQYHIEAELCVGGMGRVFRGVHVYLGRPAAVKVMHAHLATEASFREHFFLEAQAIATLKHENIVNIYDFGEQDGLLYLVMELMPDGSLHSLLPQYQELSLALKVDLVRQAADGLAAAHDQGLIHCDIKPDNLLLTRLNGRALPYGTYRLKISDFGLVHFAENERVGFRGLPMGTAAYMSPEQWAGKKVNAQSDLYALGIVLYELIFGSRPFQSDNMQDGSDGSYKYVTMIPALPYKINPEIAIDLEEIILRCLVGEPERRYASAKELANDLRSVLGSMLLDGLTLPQVDSAGEIGVSDIGEQAGDFVQDVSLLNEDLQASNGCIYAAQDMLGSDSALDCTRIGIVVDQKTLSIMPGQRITTEVTIINLGNTADRFAMSVEGFESSWIEGLEPELDMKPGMRKTVVLAISVDRAAENLAQIYTVLIRVRSHEEPTASGTIQVHWEVLPFYEAFMRIEPVISKGFGKAQYNVVLGNTGNALVQYVLSGDDEERQFYYQFDETLVRLEPEEEVHLKLMVHSQRSWVGHVFADSFHIAAFPLGDWMPLDNQADLVSKPILPQWVFATVGVMLIVGSLLLAVSLRRHLPETGRISFMTNSVSTTAVPTTPIGSATGVVSPGGGSSGPVIGGAGSVSSGNKGTVGSVSTGSNGTVGSAPVGPTVGSDIGRSSLPSAVVTSGAATALPTGVTGSGSLPTGSGVGIGVGSGTNWGIGVGVGVPTSVPGCSGTATPVPQSTATSVHTRFTSPTFYLHANGQLDNTEGSLAKVSTITSAGGEQKVDLPMNTTVYTATGITGTYDKSARTMFNFYVDQGTAVGNGIQVRVVFDFNGDGRSLGIETYHYFALDNKSGWERYTQDSFDGLEPPAPTFANFHNGKITVEVWNAIGNDDTGLSTDAPFNSGSQSSITIPYTF